MLIKINKELCFFSKIDLHNFLVGKNVGNGLNNELNQILNGLLY